MQQKKDNRGRPIELTEDLAVHICEAIALSHHGLHWHCENDPKFPSYSTITRWKRNNPEFSKLYAGAKQDQADHIVEGIIDIVDDCAETKNGIEKAYRRTEARKWVAGRLKPRVYSEKTFTGSLDKDGEAIDQAQKFDLSKLTENELINWRLLQEKAIVK